MHSKELIDKVKEIYQRELSYRKVAKILNLSRTTVHYMVNTDYDRKKKVRGPSRIINRKDSTKVKRAVRYLAGNNQKVTAKKIIQETGITCSKSTMHRELTRQEFKYKKVKQSVSLTRPQMKKRLEISEKWISDNHNWKATVFTDEKRFSFDGPDNWCTYMDENSHFTRKKRQQGGGGIMVWGMLLPDGFIHLELLIGRQKSSNYVELIKKKVHPILQSRMQNVEYYFQQDNCSIHVSAESRSALGRLFPRLLEWPSKSPDLNIIENVWKLLSDKVYESGQYSNAQELWKSVQDAAKYLMSEKRDILTNLFNSMNHRLLKVIKSKGKLIDY